jgi:hypothetical protein
MKLRILAVVVIMLLSGMMAVLPLHSPTASSAGPSAPPQPATTIVVGSYSVPLTALPNSTASSAYFDYSNRWTVQSDGYAVSPAFDIIQDGSYSGINETWNGTLAFVWSAELDFVAGEANYAGTCAPNLGVLWANVTMGGQFGSTELQVDQGTSASCPSTWTFHVAFQIHLPRWAYGVPLMTLTAAPYAPYGNFGVEPPAGLETVHVAGQGSVGLQSGGLPTAGLIPSVDWGWHWYGSSATSSSFSPPGSVITSPVLSWSSPYDVNATYNSVTQTETTSGTFSIATPTTVKFQSGRVDAASVYSFIVTYTISGTANVQFVATYNYTQPWTGGAQLKTSTTFAATTIGVWNGSYDEYTYTIPTPFSNITRIWVALSTGCTLLSAWPNGNTVTSGNNTVTWPGAGQGVPTQVQVVCIGPLQYGSGQLTIIYIPSSPVFALFGAALPYAAVETYVNGVFAPYATLPVTIGQTYSIQTYDIFNHLLYSGQVIVNSSSQVDAITLDIWPMSIVNLNSSYVVSLNIQNYGVTQIAPDLMPLQSYVFYLSQGEYNFTIQYLAFGGGAVGSPTTFKLNISGVSYDVINGLTFLSVIANEQEVGNNVTKVIVGVNLTLISTVGNLENLINSVVSGLYSYHFTTGTASRTANSFSVPITVTTNTGAIANISVVQQMAQTLSLTYINQTGTFIVPAFASGATSGQFTLTYSLSTAEVTALENGTSAMIMTATATYGKQVLIGTGIIAGAVIRTAIPVGTPVNPLSQDVYLNLGNTTRNSTSGFSTAFALWTNGFNQTYAGEFTLTGAFVGQSSITVMVNGTTLLSSQYAVTSTGLIIFAGVLNVPVGTSVSFRVTYEPASSFNFFTSSLGQFGAFSLSAPYLLIAAAAITTGAAGIADYQKRDKNLTRAFAAGLFFLVFGAMILL